jgi:tetrahydromethanopterin S-methyltransferase subunit F
MSDFWYGLIAGIIVGMVIVFILTRGRQKPWSEMTEREKRITVWLIGVGVVLLVAGVVVALLAM